MFEDLLKRFLVFMNYKVTHVMNITDIDDKTIKGANEQGISLTEFTKKYIKAFFDDINTLNISRADHYPKATENIKEMAKMVKGLNEKGFAYKKDGSYYFKISKFKNYGSLSKIKREELKSGVRIDSDEYEKEDVHDFVLWKARKEDEPYWETEIGTGRPGWHIECSVMSTKFLGDRLDIHCGGVDNIFPHHENEIAQSEAYTGKKFVNYWLHCQHLIRDGEKMSKSKGNTITLKDLMEKHAADPKALRFLLLSTHYRKMLNFTFAALEQAKSSLDRINNFLYILGSTPFKKGENKEVTSIIIGMKEDFIKGLSDDLNISVALKALFEMIRQANALIIQGKVFQTDAENLASAVKSIDSVLGVATFPRSFRILVEKASKDMSIKIDKQKPDDDLPEDVKQKIAAREKARGDKNYKLADRIREELLKKGIVLEDTKDGVRWKITKKREN
jgi:cysteinyl-tRNA synthetase